MKKPLAILMKNLLTSLAIVALGASVANAADGTWTNDGSSNWSTTTNWADGIVADGAGFLADFSTIDITASRLVTLDSSRTIGGLSFRDTNWTNSGFNWNLQSSGGSILTLDNTGGPGGNPPTISLATGISSITTVLAGSNGLNLSLPWSNYYSTRGTASGGFGLVLSETTARLIFNANNTVSGALSVNGGVINTYGAFSTFGNVTSLVLSGNSFFQNGETTTATPANNNGRVNRIGDGTATLTLGGASGAGIFSSAFAQAANTTSQTFAGLTVNAGQNILNTSSTAAGTNNLIFTGTGGAGYVRNTNGLLNIATATGFTPQFTNAPTAAGGSSVSGAGSDAILIGAILNGSNFIAAASGNVGNATYVTTLTADKNVNVTGNLATSGNISINSLRLGDTTKRTVTIGASDTLTIASGGILLPSSMATANINHTITGGNLTSGQGDLWIYSASGSTGINNGNGNPRAASYSATIASKITGAISLTVGGGTAQILLSGANDYTGGTYLENGFIAVNADSGLGAASGTVTAVSGVNNIAPTAGFTFDASRNFVINSGALLQFGDRGQTNTIAGQISGGGQLGIGFVSNAQRLILTGNNTGFTGQYLVNGYLRAVEGTGLSSNANLTFNGRGPGFVLGVLETSGSFTRSLGSGAGQVQWQSDAQYGSGGFAAVGGELNVNIGGNVTPDTVTWGSGYFLPGSGQELILGSAASTHDVTFQNSIALNDVQRGIRVTANGTTKAILSGTLSGNATSGINKQGTGTLVLTGDNSYQGATTVTAGTLQIGDGTTDGSISSSSGITNNATLVYNLIGSQSYNNAIGGTGNLTKSGTGTLTLGGSNTYTGLTTVSAGTLALSGGNDRLATTGAITIGASGTLDLGGNTQTTTGVVTFTSGATLRGGTLTSNNAALAGNNFFTGTINLGADGAFVTNRRLLVANGGTNSLTIGTGSTGSITFGGDAGSNMNYVGVGTGNGTLNVNGGTVNFNNSTVGTGNGYLNAGSNSGSATGSIVVNGGNMNVGTLLKLGGNFNNIAGTNATSSLTITTGTVTVGGGDAATNNGVLFMNGGAGDNTVNTGNSTLTLNSGGVLNAKQIQAGNQGTKTINLDGGTLRAGGNSTTFLNAATGLTVNVKDGGVTIDTQAFDITAAAALVANGTGGLTKTGSGALVLSGNNTYTGVTTISAGTLQIGDGTTNGSIAASSNIVNSSTLTVNQASGSTSLNAITGTGNVTKSGAGSLTLSQANTIGGNLTLSAGTLDLSGLTSSLAGNLNISGGTLQNGTLTLTGTVATNNVIANFTGNATVSANLTSSTVGFFKSGAGTLLLTGTSSFSNSVLIANFSILGGGTLQVGSGGALSSASRVIIQGGSTLLIDAGAGAVSFGGDAGGTSNFVGVDSGVGNLSMAGGTLNFNTTNVNGAGYLRVGAGSGVAGTSNMTVSGGTVNVGHSASIGASFNNGASAATNNGTLTISGGTVKIGTGTDTATANGVNGALYLKNNTAGTSGTATLNLDGGTLSLKQVIAGSQGTSMVNFNGGTLQARANSANFLDAAAGLTANVKDGGAMIDTQAFDITVGAALVADGTGGLTKFGGGTLILNQANTYSGGTTLNSGTLRLDHASAAGSGTLTQSSGASLLHLNATGTFANAMSVYNVKASETLTLSGGITVNNATFDVDDGDTLTISNTVSGTGGVTKNGTGTLVLSGSNTFNGDTQVNAGTLHAAAANALGSTGNITVTGGSLLVGANDAIGNSTGIDLAGGTLEFSGNVTDTIGALTLSANSVIDLGTGSVVAIFADLFMGSYTLAVHNWTGTTLWNGGTGNNTDQIYFNRALGSGELSRISFYSDFGSSFVGTGFQLGLGSGFQYQVIPVPEPETWLAAALLLVGAGVAWARGRRRREG